MYNRDISGLVHNKGTPHLEIITSDPADIMTTFRGHFGELIGTLGFMSLDDPLRAQATKVRKS